MSDIKLFRLGLGAQHADEQSVAELISKSAELEKHLQRLVETNMETILGVKCLASEFTTSNNGRIDSIGIDELGCPVIIEYKRHSNENVINQGLFYYDWLLDHKADFTLLVMDKLKDKQPAQIEWDGARLICIAASFSRYDEYAIKQIDRNIELIRYQYFGDDLFLLELVNTQTKKEGAKPPASSTATNAKVTKARSKKPNYADKYHSEILQTLETEDKDLLQRYRLVCDVCESLGDEVQRKELKLYTAFKRMKNFASFHVLPGKRTINMYLKVDPSTIQLEDGFSHDATKKGHWGTGDLEIIISSDEDVEKAMPLITMSFDNS